MDVGFRADCAKNRRFRPLFAAYCAKYSWLIAPNLQEDLLKKPSSALPGEIPQPIVVEIRLKVSSSPKRRAQRRDLLPDRSSSPKAEIGSRRIDIIKRANIRDDLSTPATLEARQASLWMGRIIRISDSPEIVERGALCFGPAHRLPLQQVIGHQVASLVARCPVEVDTLLAYQRDKSPGQQFPSVFSEQEVPLMNCPQQFPGTLIVGERMTSKAITLPRDLHQLIPAFNLLQGFVPGGS